MLTTLIIFFILGLIIGSFLNVIIYRLNLAQSILGRSQCPHCKAKIRWYDNIPLLSFIILGTKCRDCGEKISWQYPAVELAAGIVFALVGHYFFFPIYPASWLQTAFYLGVFSALIVIFVYDLKYMEIPMIAVWSAVGLAIVYWLVFDWMNSSFRIGFMDLKILSALMAGIGAFLFFFVISYISKEKWMGKGDAYVALLAGVTVGIPGILLTVTLAFAIGSLVGIILVSAGRKKMQSQIPFAPFLTSAVIIMVILQQIFPIADYFWI